MAVILNRRGNVSTHESNKVNIRKSVQRNQRRIRVKTSPKVREELKKIKDSIEKSKTPERVVKIRTLRNVPKTSLSPTKEFLKIEPKNINPETKRKRNWTVQKYPSILPPPRYIRKIGRTPKPIFMGSIGRKVG